MKPTVSELFVYPIKSCRGNLLTKSRVQLEGLTHDRRFTLINAQGTAVTGRTHPSLTKLVVSIVDGGVEVVAPDGATLLLNYADFSREYLSTKVWKSVSEGQYCSPLADKWFSDYLNYDCRLVFWGDKTTRKIKDFDQQVSFADGYPLLLAGEQSLVELNKRATQTHSIKQFRTNIVVSGSDAFAEDHWHKIRIGEVEFLMHSPCSRCKFTQVNLDTGRPFPAGEPLSVLNQFRRGENNKAYFGHNIIPLNEGMINTNDEVVVLETKQGAVYPELTAQ